MTILSGKSYPVPSDRRLMCDLMSLQREIPAVPYRKSMALARLYAARKRCPTRISWVVLFIKGLTRMSEEFPVLRRAYMPGLTPRIYEHPSCIANLALERSQNQSSRLFFARFHQPESKSLLQIQRQLIRFQNEPLPRHFGDQLRISKFPWPIRHLILRAQFCFSGRRRAKRLGTIGITTLAAQGIEIEKPICPIPFIFTYGQINSQIECPVTFCADHRLIDGMAVSEILSRMEIVLNNDIADELDTIRTVDKDSSGFRLTVHGDVEFGGRKKAA